MTVSFHCLPCTLYSKLGIVRFVGKQMDVGECDPAHDNSQLYGALNHPKDKNQKQYFGACQNWSN